MINKTLLENVKTKLSDVYAPLSIYVFGSYAWGVPTSQNSTMCRKITQRILGF